MSTQTTQVLLAARPHGEPTPADFETVTVDLPPLQDGQVLLEVRYLSLDPYMRGRMSDAKSYADPVPVGGVMVGATVCQVVESRSPDRQVGDWVLSYSGWQTRAVAEARHTRGLDPERAPGQHGARRAGDARVHGVRRTPAARQAAAGRDRRGRRRHRTGRFRRRPDREAEGRAGRRHRRRAGQVPGARRGVRLRRRGRPPRGRLPGPAGRRRTGRDRRLLRERRRRRLASGRATPQPLCADPGLRAGRRLQRHRRGRRPGPVRRLHAPGADQEPHRARLHPERVRARALRRVPGGDVRLGARRSGPLPRGRHGRPGERRRGVHGHARRPELREGARQGDAEVTSGCP